MCRKRSDYLLSKLAAFLTCLGAVIPAFAGTDPNPNSPVPVLLTAPDSTHALATSPTNKAFPRSLPRMQRSSFELYSKIVVYVTNVDLMPGEDADAFRAYAVDARARIYRFPVLRVQPLDKQDRVYALTIELRDEIGYWDDPPERGDVLLSVAWRGLASNSVRLSIGSTGGPMKDGLGTAIPNPSKIDSTTPQRSSDDSNIIGYTWSGDRTRFLEQATFGPTPALDLRVRRIGIRAWLAEQFDMAYPSPGNPYPNFPIRPTNPSSDCNGQIDAGIPDPDPFCYVNHYTMYPVQNWFYKEAFYGDAQLRHRVAWALAQLWVISGVETQQSSHMAAYHKVLSRNAFGNWRTLMYEMTLNPGMGDYLNMRTSTRFSPNENYAREILQLFNLGVFMLNPNGTFKTDQQGNPIPTYDQTIVNNFTLVFTGWSLCETSPTLCPNRFPGSPNFIDPMIITNPNNHDLSAKTLLDYPGSTTTSIAACSGCTGTQVTTYAANSLNHALDNIYNHPNTAPFVSRFLIQQLITGDPTPAYVGRVAAVFNANRVSPSQMKEVIKAILLDPEARGDIKTEPRYGKLREPVMFVTNLARQFEVRSFERSDISDGVLTTETNAMGQTAFMSPSVFNFYPPDYIVPGTTFNGPEFGLLTTGTSVSRINFANTLIFNGVNLNTERRVTSGTSISVADIQALAESDPTGNDMMDVLNLRMMHGTMSPQMRSTILNAVLTVPASNPLLRAKRAVYLVATSSQYQIQR
ncbi:MAG TPA: DUF1800 family protein [Pyrinomonadaceae bacterium]